MKVVESGWICPTRLRVGFIPAVWEVWSWWDSWSIDSLFHIGDTRTNPIDLVGRFAGVFLEEVFLTRFHVSLLSAVLPGPSDPSFHSHTADALWLAWGLYLFLLGRPGERVHWCIKTCACVHANAHAATEAWGRSSFTLPALLPPPLPRSWPTFFSSLVAPSLIAARHTEAICSTEACRHGDAGRLYGFAVDWPTGKWRSGNGGRV